MMSLASWFRKWHRQRLARESEQRCAQCRYAFVLVGSVLFFRDTYNAHCRNCPDNVLLPPVKAMLEQLIDAEAGESGIRRA